MYLDTNSINTLLKCVVAYNRDVPVNSLNNDPTLELLEQVYNKYKLGLIAFNELFIMSLTSQENFPDSSDPRLIDRMNLLGCVISMWNDNSNGIIVPEILRGIDGVSPNADDIRIQEVAMSGPTFRIVLKATAETFLPLLVRLCESAGPADYVLQDSDWVRGKLYLDNTVSQELMRELVNISSLRMFTTKGSVHPVRFSIRCTVLAAYILLRSKFKDQPDDVLKHYNETVIKFLNQENYCIVIDTLRSHTAQACYLTMELLKFLDTTYLP